MRIGTMSAIVNRFIRSRYLVETYSRVSIQHRRMASSKSIDFHDLPEHRSLVIEKFGEPAENVLLKTKNPQEVLPKELAPNEVLIEHLAACINPADINIIQGVYGRRPNLPAIIGNEGVARVKSVGSQVNHLSPGDMALGVSLMGYWQNYSVQDGGDLYKVDDNLDVNVAAQLKVNPCTAYRMIKDFCHLDTGDVILQNGANSAVGMYAIQLAKFWGYRTINVIRDRPNKADVVRELKDLGADYVITEAEVSSIESTSRILKETGKPKLFLNCVGGKNAMDCQRLLDQGGISVTYGAMSKSPFSLSAASLIFKDHKFVGFWVSRWYQERERSKRNEISNMLNEVASLFNRGVLRSKATTEIDFEERNVAFGGSSDTKYIFSINKR